jgi:tetratricopeptide (TPR) repeat protein
VSALNKTTIIIRIFLAVYLFGGISGLRPLAAQSRKGVPEAGRADKQPKRNNQLIEATFADAVKYYLLERYDDAREGFAKALALDPKNAAIQYKLAETLHKLQKTAEAIPYAEEAALLEPKNKYYYLLLGELYRKELKLEKAARTYEVMLKQVPNTKEYHFDLAALYLYMGKYKEAMVHLNTFESYFGLSEEVVKQRQYIYLRQNKLDKAVEEGNKLIEAFPGEIKYTIAQAELLLSNNKTSEAKKILEKLIKEKPRNAMALLLLHNLYKAEGKTQEAKTALESAFEDPDLNVEQKINIIATFLTQQTAENLETARELTERTLKVHPNDPRALGLLGDILYTQNQKQEARVLYTKALERDGNNFNMWRQLIVLDYELQSFDSMVQNAGKAVELFPTQGLLWFFKGTGEVIQKKYKEASVSLEEAKTLTKATLDVYLQVLAQLGDVYHYLKEHAKSDAAYEEVLKKDPQNAIALNNYAYFLSLRGEKLLKAKEMSGGLVSKEPENATYLDTYAWVLYKLGEYALAKEYLEKAVSYDGGNGVILEHLGDAYYKLGQVEQALELWQKALKAGDASEFIQKKVADKKLYE